MENKMEASVERGLYRDPGIQIIPTLGPKTVNINYISAIWIPRACLRLLHANIVFFLLG